MEFPTVGVKVCVSPEERTTDAGLMPTVINEPEGGLPPPPQAKTRTRASAQKQVDRGILLMIRIVNPESPVERRLLEGKKPGNPNS
jgi:hypothetical protein